MNLTLVFLQLIVILGLAPLSMGMVRFCKARLQGRHGASPLLPYVTLATLMRKQMVISKSVSWVFRSVPYVVLGSVIFLAAMLPLIAGGLYSDFIVIAGVLMIGAVFLVLGGLDSASAFGGMGASREMTLAALIEPAVIMTFATLAVLSGFSSIDGMLAAQMSFAQMPYLALPIAALIFIALAENARYPVDNPATHLELTMVHEAMVLEYSGPYLAMLEFASAIKLTIFAILIGNFIVPTALINFSTPLTQGAIVIGLAIIKLVVGMVVLALLESLLAKMRFYRMDEYLSGAFFLALAGMIMALIYHTV